ncbi:MAG TPA: DUF1329 domain-containing protein [Candidatus Eisenbacteria bacterium]|nr:DUF1329 domain-containing protein [Candidatus Eisenbacteria bacterium]
MSDRRFIVTCAAALAICLRALVATADVSPGDKINDSNVDKAKDLISPGLEWCIKHGLPITVVETKKVEWPRAYKEATEKYAGQVKLTPDGMNVQNYVAGQPFPALDPKDPQFAIKVMWNYEYGFVNGIDDTDLRNFDADTGSIPAKGPMTVERHFLLDHLRRLFWTGRLYVEPKPSKPNPNGYRAQQGLYPILEPFDLKGVGALGNRYTDSAKQDDSWLYLPSLRRVRRLSTAQRSDALFGQDTDVDSYYGYAGHISWMEWKFLGEKEVLGAVHAQHFPVKWDDKVDWAFDDVWEKRKVYVIEGISKLPQYAYSKRVLYIDKEYWGIPFSDIYDRSGELWKIWINDLSFRKSVPGGIVYEDEMPFAPAIDMVDMQLEHATKASLPSPRFPGEQGWYYHQGEKAGITDDWFTVAALVGAGH